MSLNLRCSRWRGLSPTPRVEHVLAAEIEALGAQHDRGDQHDDRQLD
jgi:hypothetical protein